MVQPLVSICIPTYSRTAFLLEAIRSCLAQKYRPLELLIGDDSAAPATEAAVEAIPVEEDLRIRYFAHRQTLGQADNLNYLLSRIEGSYFVVLHDDDMLVPGAVERLQRALRTCSDAVGAFGLQYIIDAEGRVLSERTHATNRYFARTPENEGLQGSIMASALRRQFPNDGFMLRRIVADQVRYRPKVIVGTGCDFDFGIQLAKAYPNHGVFFLHQYVSKYRIGNVQISSKPVRAPMLKILADLQVEDCDKEHLAAIKKIFAVRTVYEHIMNGDKASARKIFFSSHFPARQRVSPKGLAFLLSMFLPMNARNTWCFMCMLAGKPLRVPEGMGLGAVVQRFS